MRDQENLSRGKVEAEEFQNRRLQYNLEEPGESCAEGNLDQTRQKLQKDLAKLRQKQLM